MVSTRKRVPTAAAPTALSSVVGPSYHAAAEVDSSHFETEPSHCPAAVGEASLNAGHASSRRQTAEKAVSVYFIKFMVDVKAWKLLCVVKLQIT